MTSTLVTSDKVEKRVFSKAKGEAPYIFQISSIQCLVVVIVAWSHEAGELLAVVPNTLFSICYDELCFTPVV